MRWQRSWSAPQQIPEAFSLILDAKALQGPQTGFRQAVVVIPKREGVRLNLGVEPKQLEIGRNCGAGSAAEPGEFRLGVYFAGIEEGLVLESLLEWIRVFGYFESGSSRLTTDPDVRGVLLNPLENMKLIPETYRFSESNVWATIPCSSRSRSFVIEAISFRFRRSNHATISGTKNRAAP